MRLLVTAGNTYAPLDRVRGITNLFTGRTGAAIASEAVRRGLPVTLLTSHPETAGPGVTLKDYRTFDELRSTMQQQVLSGQFDVIIHAAAVSDFLPIGTYAPEMGTLFQDESNEFISFTGSPRLRDVGAGKVSSRHEELWVRMKPAPKLVDLIRTDWGFRGILVKFKLEVDLPDEELIARGSEARLQSQADLLIANTLEGKDRVAFLLAADRVQSIPRSELAARLMDELERMALR